MKEKLKTTFDIKHRGLILIILFIFYGALIKPHYASDSYYVYFDSDNGAIHSARYLTFIWSTFLTSIGINIIEYQSLWTVLAIILLAETVYELWKKTIHVLRIKGNSLFILVMLSCLILCMNIYIIEWFLFPEVVLPYTFGLYFSIKAALLFADELNKRKLIVAVLYLLIGINTYQINLGFFLIIALCLIGLKRNLRITKKSISETIWAVLTGLCVSLINIFLIKILHFKIKKA